MKKAFLLSSGFVFCFLASVVLTPLSAFATNWEGVPNSNTDAWNNILKNQYGVIPFREGMNPKNTTLKDKEGHKYFESRPSITKIGGALCSIKTKARFANDSESLQRITRACEKFTSQEGEQALILLYDEHDAQKVNAVYVYAKNKGKPPFASSLPLEYVEGKGFVLKYTQEDKDNQEYEGVFFEVNNNACYREEEYCDYSNGSFHIQVNPLEYIISPEQWYDENDNYKMYYRTTLFGTSGIFTYINAFSSFTVNYPSDFPEEYKPDRTISGTMDEIENGQIRKYEYHPRIGYNLEDKDFSALFMPPKFELPVNTEAQLKIYKEKENENTVVFSKTDKLFSEYKHTFEEYGTYYVRTVVQPPAPVIVQFKIIQPVWTEIKVDGGTYHFLPDGKSCNGSECKQPDVLCSVKFKDIAKASLCEFNRLNNFIKDKLGLLWFPFDLSARMIYKFQTANVISCSVNMGAVKIDACIIEQKFSPLYTFLKMASNGTLLFAFALFLKNQLSGFVSEQGGE